MWRRAICVRDLSLSHGGLEGLARRGFLRADAFEVLVGSFRAGSTAGEDDTVAAASAPRQRATTKAPATLGA